MLKRYKIYGKKKKEKEKKTAVLTTRRAYLVTVMIHAGVWAHDLVGSGVTSTKSPSRQLQFVAKKRFV